MANYKLIRKKVDKTRKKTNKKRLINQEIFKVSVFFAVIFFVMVIFLGKYLAFDSSSIINNNYNKRSENLKRTVKRGEILSSEGNVLAYTETDDQGNEYRVYPYGDLFFHAVGFETNGGLGIESAYKYYLLTSHENIFSKIGSEFGGNKVQGDSLKTTLVTDLQLACSNILGDNEGAIIVMNPQDGAILAMVSKPGFDPNYIDQAWAEITGDENNSVLVNRVTNATLTPGSTFKMFTLLEYYKEHKNDYDNFAYDCNGYISVEGHTFGCPYGNTHGYQDLKASFANSCNCAFSQIAKELDLNSFITGTNKLLFNTDLGLDFTTKSSSFNLDENSSDFMIAQTAFGQGETLVSPIHLAMITSAIANNGILMKPHMAMAVIDSEGREVSTFKNEIYGSLLTMDEAQFMKEYMRAVVTQGTAMILSYDGNYISYGKTGTAETSNDKEEGYDHSWFTGFAENNGNTIVVCAMIENTQKAGITGVYAAKQIFDYWFN